MFTYLSNLYYIGSPGLARSPAMHQGFRQEEWVVERTPVNTPDTANDKVSEHF